MLTSCEKVTGVRRDKKQTGCKPLWLAAGLHEAVVTTFLTPSIRIGAVVNFPVKSN